mmetsp:Transcript_46613/g.149743  ORF Transcript_46613/g.149743 Transcript_46613/m.149743 type:complete len:202 (-) Transcript_46613:145-750(-)
MSLRTRWVRTMSAFFLTLGTASWSAAYMCSVHGSTMLGKRKARSPREMIRLERTAGSGAFLSISKRSWRLVSQKVASTHMSLAIASTALQRSWANSAPANAARCLHMRSMSHRAAGAYIPTMFDPDRISLSIDSRSASSSASSVAVPTPSWAAMSSSSLSSSATSPLPDRAAASIAASPASACFLSRSARTLLTDLASSSM